MFPYTPGKMIQKFETVEQLDILQVENKGKSSSSIENVATMVVEASIQLPDGSANEPGVFPVYWIYRIPLYNRSYGGFCNSVRTKSKLHPLTDGDPEVRKGFALKLLV
ncbi:hypothetical protein TNIN_17531 [Trichonephila inaurata madagascariensis]|uniref:Uncharacterized protein n=1 Tax=Trichonephila inaurata madagascariensis TaxID=2747483 RepID=A0A8X6IQQ6_9ARAC|nr:hypothetical protein TNIN_17531 [Trichonephila inaurata madagascariensis]